MEKQRARTDNEKEYRKEQLKKAALQLFTKYGFKTTTVQMITQKAQLSPAAFYLYFKNKIAIYRELNNDGIDILEHLLKQTLEKKRKQTSDKLYDLADAYYAFFKKYKNYFYITEVLHIGNKEFFYDRAMVKMLEQRTVTLIMMAADVISDGIKKGEFKKIDAVKTAVSLWGMIDGVLFLEVKRSTGFAGFCVEELIQQMMKIAVEGIAIEKKTEKKNKKSRQAG